MGMGKLFEKLQPVGKKLSNVAIAFVVMLAWVLSTDYLIPFLGPPQGWGGSSAVWGFLMACVVAPFWEELAFRVIPIKIATQLDSKLGTKLLWPIIALSSIMFGLGHDTMWPFHLLWQGAMGVVFCYLYLKNNQSYWPNVVLHALWNFFVIYILT